MLQLALQTIKTRRVVFIGMLLALSLSVALIAAMSSLLLGTFASPVAEPQRYANAPVVIVPATPHWAEKLQASDKAVLAADAGLPGSIIAPLRATGSIVIDRVFPVYAVQNGASATGRPWSSHALAPHVLQEGREPRAANEIVTNQSVAALHQDITVVTQGEAAQYKVVGTVAESGTEQVIFFEDTETARLSPRIDAIAAFGSVADIRKAAGSSARILTGTDRRSGDPGVTADIQALTNTRIVAGITGGIAAFIAIFIVASTFAFSVAQRQHEFALLRMLGALPRQIKRAIQAEALIIGGVSVIVGGLLALLLTGLIAHQFVAAHIAPSWFAPELSVWPFIASAVVGLSMAYTGALSAARRAAAISPVAAMRDATTSDLKPSRSRRVWAMVLLLCAITAMAFIAATQPFIATLSFIYIWCMLLPIFAGALYVPYAVPVLVRIILWLSVKLRNALAVITQGTLVTNLSRTSAVVAPVVLMVGTSLTLLAAIYTMNSATDTELSNRVTAPYAIVPAQGGTFSDAMAAAATTPETIISTVRHLVAYANEDGSIRPYDILAVQPKEFEATTNIRMLEGSFAALTPETVVVTKKWETALGQTIEVRFANGDLRTLKVVGIAEAGVQSIDADAFVSSGLAPPQSPISEIWATHKPNASIDTASMQTALAPVGAKVVPRTDWLASHRASTMQAALVGLTIMLGLVIIYSSIAIVNTLVMASAGRTRAFRTLRMVGATQRQIVAIAAAEGIIAAATGTMLAFGASAIGVYGLYTALAQLVPNVAIAIPWHILLWVILATAILTVAVSTLPVFLGLRQRWLNRADKQ